MYDTHRSDTMNRIMRILPAAALLALGATPALAQGREPFRVEVAPRPSAATPPDAPESPTAPEALAVLVPPAAPRAQSTWDQQVRGWLGIASESAGSGAKAVVRVVDVYPGSPAERSGVQKGDTILKIDGRTATGEAMRTLSVSPGDTVKLRTRRGGREQVRTLVAAARPERVREPIAVTLPPPARPSTQPRRPDAPRALQITRGDSGEVILLNGRDTVSAFRFSTDSLRLRADSLHAQLRGFFADSMARELREVERRMRAAEPDIRRLQARADSMATAFTRERVFAPAMPRGVAGAEFTELTPELAGYFPGAREGVLVIRVAPETPAARAGLAAGDVVVRAGTAATPDVRTLSRAVASARGTELPLEVVRKGKAQRLTLKWER
jgi:predicted metalloprotease with PDZ domain